MDKLPPEAEPDSADGSPSPVENEVVSERQDSLAAQIRRQVRDEAGGSPSDPSFDFQMRLRAGSNELSDEAQRFAEEHGEEYQAPEFSEGGWDNSGNEGSAGGGLNWLIIGLAVLALLVAGWFYGLPAYKANQQRKAEAAKAAEMAAMPVLDPVLLDDSFHESLLAALEAANSSLTAEGIYVYRYRVSEERNPPVSQVISVTGVTGGKEAATAEAKLNAALVTWKSSQESHAGVSVKLSWVGAADSGGLLDGDRYVRYGREWGKEHSEVYTDIVAYLESEKQREGAYPRVLPTSIDGNRIKTSGGFTWMARGIGYLPVYETNSAGHIIMGAGSSSIDQLTPRRVKDYYLFVYLDKATSGLDCYSSDAPDYYMRKIAPLPYDPGGPLSNVPLRPDGKPDGIGCVLRNGELHDIGG